MLKSYLTPQSAFEKLIINIKNLSEPAAQQKIADTLSRTFIQSIENGWKKLNDTTKDLIHKFYRMQMIPIKIQQLKDEKHEVQMRPLLRKLQDDVMIESMMSEVEEQLLLNDIMNNAAYWFKQEQTPIPYMIQL